MKIYVQPEYKPDFAHLEHFQESIQHELPRDYAQFLSEFNGGITWPPIHDMNRNHFHCTYSSGLRNLELGCPLALLYSLFKDEKQLNMARSLVPGIYGKLTFEDIVERYDYLRGADVFNLPSNVLPIGECNTGDILCMCLSGEKSGQIFLIIEGMPDELGVNQISNSFSNFTKSMAVQPG